MNLEPIKIAILVTSVCIVGYVLAQDFYEAYKRGKSR